MNISKGAWRPALVGVLCLSVAAGAFGVVRRIDGGGTGAAQQPPATEPPADSTPPPGNPTPDRRSPNWYVPYLNADRDKPKFVGTIAGIRIAPFDGTELGGCPAGTLTAGVLVGAEFIAKAAGTRLAIDLSSAPRGLTPASVVKGDTCDGELINATQYFDVREPFPGVKILGNVKVFRYLRGTQFWFPQAADRWSEGIVAGRPVALLIPVVDAVGESAVIFTDGDGYTAVLGAGVLGDTVRVVAEELLK